GRGRSRGSSSTSPTPIFFETADDQTTSAPARALSSPFLKLNNNTIELGNRVGWGTHVVWYLRSFFLLAEQAGAGAGYGLANGTASTPVSFDGRNVTASSFLTGEQVTRRVNMIQPSQDFNFNFVEPGEKFTPGAIEACARYGTMNI